MNRKLADDNPGVTQFQSDPAESLANIGGMLRQDPAAWPKHCSSYESALAIRRKLADDHPAIAQFQSGLASSYTSFGNLLIETGQPAKAPKPHESAPGDPAEAGEPVPRGAGTRQRCGPIPQ